MNDLLKVPLNHWSLLRCKLGWAYDNPLGRRQWEWPYIPDPVAGWLIRKGSVTLRFASGEEEHYDEGMWVFPKAAGAMQIFTPGAHLLSIRFEAEWCYGVPILDRSRTVAFAGEEEPCLTRDGEALAAFIRKHYPEAHQSSYQLRGDFGFYLELQPIFMQWVGSYYRAMVARGVPFHTLQEFDARVRAALYAIENRPLAIPLTGKDLAHEAGCSVSQLNKLFVRQVGPTPLELWGRRRLAAAKSELLGSSQSIKVIAFDVGFSSTEHFTRWFRKSTGFAPSEFRRLYSYYCPVS